LLLLCWYVLAGFGLTAAAMTQTAQPTKGPKQLPTKYYTAKLHFGSLVMVQSQSQSQSHASSFLFMPAPTWIGMPLVFWLSFTGMMQAKQYHQ
jgi:hypothetical protein